MEVLRLRLGLGVVAGIFHGDRNEEPEFQGIIERRTLQDFGKGSVNRSRYNDALTRRSN